MHRESGCRARQGACVAPSRCLFTDISNMHSLKRAVGDLTRVGASRMPPFCSSAAAGGALACSASALRASRASTAAVISSFGALAALSSRTCQRACVREGGGWGQGGQREWEREEERARAGNHILAFIRIIDIQKNKKGQWLHKCSRLTQIDTRHIMYIHINGRWSRVNE